MTFSFPGSEDVELASNIRKVIEHRSSNSARSLQKEIGVSEAGEKCARRLAYKIAGQKPTNPPSDPWASIQGTAIHAWLAEAFERFNDKDAPRFLIERKVNVTDDLAGTADLFDIIDGMVIDHKCVGATSMKNKKRDGIDEKMRIQVNLYGYAYEKLGYTVNKVALIFYPLGGRLDGMHTVIEDYNRQIALKAIERLDGIKLLVLQLDPMNNAQNWALIPAVASYGCVYCPYYLPGSNDLSIGCPGEVNAQ